MSRLVPIGTGPNQGDFTMPALFLQTQGNNSLVDNVLLDGINIKCANMKGAGVLWGSVLNSEVKNSTIYNGAHAIANATIGANYTLRVTDCRLGGFDCPYFGSYSIFRGERLTIIGTGRDTFRFLSCDVVLRDVSAGAPAVNANTFMAAYSADYGGSYVLRDILSDCEGDLYATSPIFLEQHAYSPTKAEFTNLNLGASNGPAITLVRKSPLNSTTWLPCQVDIRGMLAGRYKPAVRVIGGVISPVDFVAPDMGPYSLNVGW